MTSVLGFPAILRASAKTREIIVLGVDGMDPTIVADLVGRGKLPNCTRLIRTGTFSPLGTTLPPQSPVAWSTFVSGTNPGGHGIFDFIARDPDTLEAYFSTARTNSPAHTLRIGKYSLPVSRPRLESLRRGPTLWKLLQDAGIGTTVVKSPVDFPPVKTGGRTLSGLSTPDIHGSYGIFSFYAESWDGRTGSVSGGRIERIRVDNGVVHCVLRGPDNTYKPGERADVPFTVELDRQGRMARIRIQSRNLLLQEREWSDWVRVRFRLLPALASMAGICRFYLKQVTPHLELYVSPVNIDPLDPALPISTPPDYAQALAEEIGPFYTQGMPEDTAALSAGVFDDDEYRRQATYVFEERMRLFDHEIDRFRHEFFFFYFSSLDLNSHAFWRCIDREHPLYSAELAARHGDFLPWLYSRIDEAIGRAMAAVGLDGLLFVVSDHGFVPFRRQFNLNSWLMDNGYAHPKNRLDRGQAIYFGNTDWGRTSAYGLGINGLYLNVRGREPEGIVAPGSDADRLRTELIGKLVELRDPKTGEPVIRNVYRPEQIYSGPYVDSAPDLLIGYNENYRASWDTILGAYPRDVLLDNLDPWSGDHCMDARYLAGTMLCNRRFTPGTPRLEDMAPTILTACGVSVPEEMTGRPMPI